MSDLFECKESMPPKDNSPDVQRVALTMNDNRQDNAMLASTPSGKMDVKNVERPRFGHVV